jgi:flagellar biosynthesis regulator FlbT
VQSLLQVKISFLREKCVIPQSYQFRILKRQFYCPAELNILNEMGMSFSCVRKIAKSNHYLLTPWRRVLLEKLTSKLCS